MRILLLITVLLTPLFSMANDACFPNLIKENMCKHADNLSNEIKKNLPIRLTDNMVLTKIKSVDRRIILTASLSYDFNVLKNVFNDDKDFIDRARHINREMSIKNVCADKHVRAFINLGGEIEYEYIFNDGSIYDVVTITDCSRIAGNKNSSIKNSTDNSFQYDDEKSFTLPKNRGWDIPLDEYTKPTSKTPSRVYPTPDNYDGSFTLPYTKGWDTPHEVGVNPKPPEPPLTFLDAFAYIPDFETVDDYNPYDDPNEINGYESWAIKFADSRSPQETEAIKKRIDARRDVFGVETPGEFAFKITAWLVAIIAIILSAIIFSRRSIKN